MWKACFTLKWVLQKKLQEKKDLQDYWLTDKWKKDLAWIQSIYKNAIEEQEAIKSILPF